MGGIFCCFVFLVFFFLFGGKGITNAIITTFSVERSGSRERTGQVISSADQRARPPRPSPQQPRGLGRPLLPSLLPPDCSRRRLLRAPGLGTQPRPTLVSFPISEFTRKPLRPASATLSAWPCSGYPDSSSAPSLLGPPGPTPAPGPAASRVSPLPQAVPFPRPRGPHWTPCPSARPCGGQALSSAATATRVLSQPPAPGESQPEASPLPSQ